MTLDLVTLRLFVAVCEEQSIAKAAQRNNIAPSAVSKRLSDLEVTAHNILFFRRSGGLQPTAAGEAMLRHARAVLRDVKQLEDEMAAFGSGAAGTVRVYANAWATALHLPGDLKRFLQRYPNVRIDLKQEVSPAAIRALQSNDADLAILGADYPVGDMLTLPYKEEAWVGIAPLGHPLAQNSRVTLQDMLAFDFVGVTKGSAIDQLVARQAAQLGQAVRMRLRVTGFEAVGAMVEAGLGISIVPEGWVMRYANSIRVVPLPLDEPWVRRRLVLCLQSLMELTSAARLLVGQLRADGHAGVSGEGPLTNDDLLLARRPF